MLEILLDALKDTTAMIPWLFGIYVALELLGHRTESWITTGISHKAGVAPFLGALLGCLPQCGFSVIASALYTRRCISLGTLLAVFISTSDEAIPVILAQQNQLSIVAALLLTKVILATLAGYGIDLFFKKKAAEPHAPHAVVVPVGGHQHCSCHNHACGESRWKTYFLFPLKHTVNIALFIFAVSFAIGFVISRFGENGLHRFFCSGTIFQPLIAVLIGLIPNCAASVAITEIYLKGAITFGSAIAGLSASGGLGLLVLIKEHRDRKETVLILTLLVSISLIAGILLNLFV